MKRFLKVLFAWALVFASATTTIINNAESVFADVIGVSTFAEFYSRFAAGTGGDIRLDADMTVTGNYSMKAPMNLDLNGHTLTIADGKRLFVYADVTVSDSTANKEGKIVGGGGQFIIAVGKANADPVKLQLDSGSIIASGTSSNFGILITNGEVVVNGGLVEAPANTIYNNVAGGKVTINGGEVRATIGTAAMNDYSINDFELTMNGGKMSAPNFAVYQSGRFIMNDGVVESAGISVRNNYNSYFEMNGGRIETTSTEGVAVNFQDGSVGVFNNGEVFAKNGVNDNIGSVAIVAFKNSDVTINDGMTIEAYGNALSGNGSDSGDSEGTNAKFTINGGTITSTNGTGMYIPQVNGETIINGGSITGQTGIEIRAGRLEVNGGTITGTDDYEVIPNLNGVTTFGAGISIAQHSTKQPIEVVINDGDVYAHMPVSFTNPQGYSQEVVDKVTLKIVNGSFNNTNGEQETLTVLNAEKITGGYYDYSVAEYVADGYYEVEVQHNGKTMITVVPMHDITVEGENSEYIVVSKDRALLTNEITIEEKAPAGYFLELEIRDEDGNLVEYENGKFIMPNKDVTIKVKLMPIPDAPDTGSMRFEDTEAVISTSTVSIICIFFGGLFGIFWLGRKFIENHSK